MNRIIQLLIFIPVLAHAQLTPEDIARRALPGTSIDSARHSADTGLIEVIAGKNILYITENGKHLIVGHIYDLESREDLTANIKAELSKAKTGIKNKKIDWETLPKDLMIEYGYGDHLIAIYSDKNCAYCQQLHSELKQHPKLFTVREIIYPISGDVEGAAQILCSDQPAESWSLAMKGIDHIGSNPDCVKEKRDRLRSELVSAQSSGIYGTPIIISKDGRVHKGALDIDSLIRWLDEGGA